MRIERFRGYCHERIEVALQPLAGWLTRRGLLPVQVTLAGSLFSLLAAGLIIADRLLPAGLVWLAAGLLDLLDGALARFQGTASASGAFLDSTLDRISEGVVFAAIVYHFAVRDDAEGAALTALALLGSLLISYTRARAESLGAQCKIGLITRAERVLLLTLGLCLDQMQAVILILVALTAFTVVQRIRHILTALRGKT